MTTEASTAAAADAVDLRRRLNEAGALVAAAGASLDRGEVPRLEALAPMIEALTADMGRLSEGQGRSLRPALVAMLDAVARLSERLLAEQARLGRRLRDSGTYRRAGQAYRRTGKL